MGFNVDKDKRRRGGGGCGWVGGGGGTWVGDGGVWPAHVPGEQLPHCKNITLQACHASNYWKMA